MIKIILYLNYRVSQIRRIVCDKKHATVSSYCARYRIGLWRDGAVYLAVIILSSLLNFDNLSHAKTAEAIAFAEANGQGKLTVANDGSITNRFGETMVYDSTGNLAPAPKYVTPEPQPQPQPEPSSVIKPSAMDQVLIDLLGYELGSDGKAYPPGELSKLVSLTDPHYENELEPISDDLETIPLYNSDLSLSAEIIPLSSKPSSLKNEIPVDIINPVIKPSAMDQVLIDLLGYELGSDGKAYPPK